MVLEDVAQAEEFRGAPNRNKADTPNDSPSSDAPSPPNRIQVGVCMGSSCFCRGNNHTVAAIKNFIAGQQLENRVALEGHLCQGQCNHGPNILIDGELHQNAQTISVLKLLCQKLQSRK